MVETIDAIHTIDDDGQPLQRGFSIKDDVARLGALLEELGDVALIVIDPISAYLVFCGSETYGGHEGQAARRSRHRHR